ncbi:MAG: biotin--[acetyl-CoA-carboxylase] ligase, partial [Bacteroidota bacterium]
MTATEQKFQLIELDMVDSTNNHAMSLIRENKAVNGMAINAAHQTAGKGQRGKVWKDEAGESINCSLIIEPELYNIQNPFHLVAVTACALRKVVEATIRHS